MSTKKDSRAIRVLVAGSVLQLFLGIIYVWSVFVRPVSERFEWEIDQVKLTSSYMLCFFVLGILAGGKIQNRIGASKVVLSGGLLLSLGMLATSFIPSGFPWMIYGTYGIAGGFGVGMAYNAIISCAQKWFPQKRGLATGVSVCCFGFSTVIFAPLIEKFIEQTGLLMTFRILAAAFGVTVILLFHFIVLPDSTSGSHAASSELLKKKQYTISEMIKTRNFYFITLSLMFGTAAFFILNPSFKTLAEDRGVDPVASTIMVMITGVANALGRLAVPFVSDKIGREKAALSILAVTAAGAASLCFAENIVFIGVVAVIAFCYGGYSGIYPLITADRFGIQNVGSNYGAIMVGFALSALLFPMIIGQIGDMTMKFIILAILAAAGAIMMMIPGLQKNKEGKV